MANSFLYAFGARAAGAAPGVALDERDDVGSPVGEAGLDAGLAAYPETVGSNIHRSALGRTSGVDGISDEHRGPGGSAGRHGSACRLSHVSGGQSKERGATRALVYRAVYRHCNRSVF